MKQSQTTHNTALPGIFQFLKKQAVQLRYGKELKLRKNWYYQPLSEGLHGLEFFKSTTLTPHWLTLNQELRAGVMIDQKKGFILEINATEDIEWIQCAVGALKKSEIKRVRISIDDKCKAEILDMATDIWNDMRIKIEGQQTSFQLRVEWEGAGTLYYSHPFINKGISPKEANSQKNIICLVLDGITAECIDKDRTPHMYAFFKGGVECSNVYSQGDWTLPAFSSMLTGQYPSKHGVTNPDQHETVLDAKTQTLPQLLREGGYRTFGYSSHLRFNPAYGHAKGFERFFFRPLAYDHNYVQQIHEAIWQLEAHRDEPNFLFLHFFDSHPPYKPFTYLKNVLTKPFRTGDSSYRTKEDGDDRYELDDRLTKLKEMDLAFGMFFSYLKEQPWFDQSTVILTADHGVTQVQEKKPLLLFDRVNIPLFVRSSELSQHKNSDFVEGNVDLMASILHLAQIETPPNVDGRLWSFLGGEIRNQAFSESLYRKVYSAVIRDHSNCYHFKCPFDEITRKISFEALESLTAYKRVNGRDVEEDVVVENNQQGDVQDKFRKYLEV